MIRNSYLTTEQAASLLGFSADHVRHLISHGKIKAEKIGQTWLIKPRAISAIKRIRKVRTTEDGSNEAGSNGNPDT